MITSINKESFNDSNMIPATNVRLADIFPLSKDQKEMFLQDGILVVDNVLSDDEINAARQGLHNTLRNHGVDHNDLEHTACNLSHLSSTNGSGGVLDIYYPSWKMNVATNIKLLSVVSQLWDIGFNSHHEDESLVEEWKRHPFGPFDVNKAYIYLDRVGYRIPTKISERIPHENVVGIGDTTSKRNHCIKRRSIQRSLTPHLDCCPQTILENSSDSGISKWRPLQSFVSLTNNTEPNTGGFEAAPGFHRQFNQWARNRPKRKGQQESDDRGLCVGQYTHIRPFEDSNVLSQIKHISCRAGSAVIWDYRIPHGNSYRNDSNVTREVIYASFLPDVTINRVYVKNQLKNYDEGKIPTDQWAVEGKRATSGTNLAKNTCVCSVEENNGYLFNDIGKKLMGMGNW